MTCLIIEGIKGPDLCQPDCVITAVRVFDDVLHHIEAVLVQERAIFISVKTSMIKGFALVSADCLPL